MNSEKLKSYRQKLLDLREQERSEVNYVVESIHEDVNINENISFAPVHLADVAGDAVDADVQVLQTARGILEEINAALVRIEDGMFGKCRECGAAISEQRLKALPYTPVCVRCAKTSEQPSETETDS
jgi:RNA polymerase-binding transcription factor DksA